MNFRDDTDSNEKILKIIRKENGIDSINFSKSNTQHHFTKKSFSLKQLFLKKNYTIGFDFRKTSVRIVKLDLASDQTHRLVLYKTIPFDRNNPDNEEQLANLKSVISHEFNASNVSIWATIPKGKTEIRFLRIPKVPKKQLLNTIYWSFKKQTSIEEHKYIFDYEILNEVKDNESKKKEIIAYAVLKNDIAIIKKIFDRIGVPLTGISIYPFALQNLIKYHYIDTEDKNICCLYVGMEWSRIDIFFPNGNLAFSRRIRACTNSMIEEIAKSINQLKTTMDFPEQSVNITDQEKGFVKTDQARKIFFSLIYNTPDLDSNINEVSLDISSQDIFEMFAPALKRLVWQVERSLESFQTNAAGNHIGKIYVSGEIVDFKPIIDFIGRNLEHQIEARDFDLFSNSILKTDGINLPESNAGKSEYVPAFGIALSRNFFTPNFLFTHKDKSLFLNSKRVNYSFAIFFILLFIFSLSGFWGQRYLLEKKNDEFAELQNKYNNIILKNNIYIDNNIIDEQISQILEKRKTAKLYAKRNFEISVLRDISKETLSAIRLYKVSINSSKNKESEVKTKVDIEGIVQGNPVFFDTNMNGFIEVLKKKPFYLKSSVISKENQQLLGDPILYFDVNVELKIDN